MQQTFLEKISSLLSDHGYVILSINTMFTGRVVVRTTPEDMIRDAGRIYHLLHDLMLPEHQGRLSVAAKFKMPSEETNLEIRGVSKRFFEDPGA